MAITTTDFIEALQGQVDECESLMSEIIDLKQDAFATGQLIWKLAQAQGMRPDAPYLQTNVLNLAIAEAVAARTTGEKVA